MQQLKTNTLMSRYSMSLIIRGKETKTTVRYHIVTIKLAINKTQKTSGVGENVQKLISRRHLWEGHPAYLTSMQSTS